jgi:hypothetical protein
MCLLWNCLFLTTIQELNGMSKMQKVLEAEKMVDFILLSVTNFSNEYTCTKGQKWDNVVNANLYYKVIIKVLVCICNKESFGFFISQ